jgi:MFS family permease
MRAIKPIHRTSTIVAKSIKLLLVSIGILLTGHGLQLTLLPVHARAIGWTDTEIGLTAAAYFFGFVLGCLSVPELLSRAGHIRVFLTVAGLTAASLLMLEAIQLLPVWILLRLANGWCLAAIYTTAESWLNEHALDHQRARLIAVYLMVTLIAIAGGQVLYGLLPVDMLFTGAAVIMMLALVPVGLFCGDQPMALKQKKFRTASIYALPPIARAGSFLSGVVTGSLWTMAPLIAEKNNLEASSVSSVMMAIVIGGGVFQLPLGYLADRIGRVRVITVASLACTLVAVTGILVVPQNTGHLAIIMFLFGGTSLSLYALCAAEANAKSRLSRVEIATLFLLLNGAGSIVGPVMTGIVSNWTEASLYVVAALAMSILLVYTAFEGGSAFIKKLRSGATWPTRAQWDTASAPEVRAP